jgi:uncharacterized membrane protein YadS
LCLSVLTVCSHIVTWILYPVGYIPGFVSYIYKRKWQLDIRGGTFRRQNIPYHVFTFLAVKALNSNYRIRKIFFIGRNVYTNNEGYKFTNVIFTNS